MNIILKLMLLPSIFTLLTFCSKNPLKPNLKSKDFLKHINSKDEYVVTATNLNIREKPDINSKIISTKKQGEKIKITFNTCAEFTTNGKQGSWLETEDQNIKGYVFSGFINPSVPSKLRTTFNFVSTNSNKITGNLSYPGEGMPACLTVCAVDFDFSSQYCTNKIQKNYHYEISIPDGIFYVYAAVPFESNFGLYSELALCGNSVECKNDKMIPVSVRNQTTFKNANPSDFYSYQRKNSWFSF